MASIVRIKRSEVAGNPASLAAGELAYSALTDNGSNGGDRLYIGMGTETSGNAVNHVVIGGKYFTDMVNAATNANTASTIVKRDASGNFAAGTITAALSGNATTASTWATARNLSLTGDATATLSSVNGSANVSAALTLATVNSNTGSFGSNSLIPVITVNAKGLITAVSIQSVNTASTLNISGDTGTDAVALNTDTLSFVGGTGITSSVTNNTVTFDIDDTVATKDYVDNVAAGLHIHEAAHCATSNTLAALSGGTVTYDNGALGVGATLTLSVAVNVIDGHALINGDRVLVKNEVNQAHNGIYSRTSSTLLTRATDFDTAAEIAGGDFTFVEKGTLYARTGWVQTDEVLTVGTDIISWQQFSGSGTFTAGDGLTLTGTAFNVGGTTDRITVNPDSVDIASTYVGQTSITTLGTIGTGTWNGTTIAVANGGTGLTTATARGIIYGNGTSAMGVTTASTIDGSFLRGDSSGNPYWSNSIDGGTY